MRVPSSLNRSGGSWKWFVVSGYFQRYDLMTSNKLCPVYTGVGSGKNAGGGSQGCSFLVVSNLVKLQVHLIHFWSYAQIIFPTGFAGQRVLTKDPTCWLDGRLPPISLLVSWTNLVPRYSFVLAINRFNTVFSATLAEEPR